MLDCFKLKFKDNKMKNCTTEIDISHNLQEAGLFARKIWQALYPIYLKYGDASNFDNFLCDLKSWERIMISQWKEGNNIVKFYWEVHGAYTNNFTDDLSFEDDRIFKIIIDTEKIGDKKIAISNTMSEALLDKQQKI